MKRMSILLVIIVALTILAYFFEDSAPSEVTQQSAPPNRTSIEDNKIIATNDQITPKTETLAENEILVTEATSDDDWAWESMNYEDDWCHLGELNDEGLNQFERVIREHQHRQGYFHTDAVFDPIVDSDLIAVDFEEYRSYDKRTLKDLGNEGDLRALTALFDKPEATNEEKYWAGYTAAIYGGTYLPSMLSTQLMMEAFIETVNSELQAENKSKYIDALAWSYFSAMRGDINAWKEITIHFEKFGRQHFSEGRLNKEDLKIVQMKANKYYQTLMAERKKRNLGAFEPLPTKIKTAIQNTILAEEIVLGFSDYWPEEFIPKDNDCFNRMVKWIEKEIETAPDSP